MELKTKIEIPIKADLNEPGIVKNVMGLACVAAFGYTAFQCSKSGFQKEKHIGTCLLGLVAGAAYLYLDYKENEREVKAKEIEYEHKETLARIKHPNCVESKAKDATPAAKMPTDLAEESKKEVCDYTPAKHNLAIDAGKGIEYLVNQYIRKGGFTIIYADKGVGKSILAHQIAMNIAEGTPCEAFPGDTNHTPQKVIYFDAEMDKGDYAERGYGAEVANMERFTSDEFGYNTGQQMLEDVERVIFENHGDCTVVLDCISSYKFGMSLSSPADMKQFNRGIDDIRKRAKDSNHSVSFIVITHASKSDKDVQKGCQEFSQNATCILSLSEIEGHGDFRTIKVVRCRGKYDISEWTVRKVPNTGNKPVHFVCEEFAEDTDVSAHSDPNLLNLKEKEKWLLDEEEMRLAKEQYVPGQNGYGMVAKAILEKRNRNPSKDNIAKMKSAVVRALKKA